MSGAPSEPEKYSIDEMMDRLKVPASSNSEEGELVTRSDGSQAIRVRKRKRRSSQPHKDAKVRTRRSRIVQVTAALVLLCVAGLLIGVAIVCSNSTPFRKGLTEKIQQATGATAEVQMFRMNPKTANAGSIALQWPEGNALKSLTLRGVTAEIFPASFLGKSFTGEEATASAGVLTLELPATGQPRVLPDFLAASPTLDFSRLRVPQMQIVMGDPAAPFLKLSDAEASLSPRNVNGNPQLSLYQGKMRVRGWPELQLDRALVVFRGNETEIVGLRMQYGKDDRGSFELAGKVTPFSEQPSTLAVKLDFFDLAGLAGPELGALIQGKVDSQPVTQSNFLTFRTAVNPDPVLDIALRVSPTSKIELHGFPFLSGLAESMDVWFQKPVFEGEAAAVFHREGNIATLRGIDFVSKDRMALRGKISVSPDFSLSGQLEVGVATNMIASANTTRFGSLFGPPEQGFRWITLKIGGSTSAPTDNFKDLYLATTPTATRGKELPADDQAPSSFEELTRPR